MIKITNIEVIDTWIYFNIVGGRNLPDLTQRDRSKVILGWKASNGVYIRSVQYPCWASNPSSLSGRYVLFVQGTVTSHDDVRIAVTLKDFSKIVEAIAEFNEHLKKKEKKPEPCKVSGKIVEIDGKKYKLTEVG